MKLFVIAFLVLSVGFAVQSLSRDDDEVRPSLRTFLLYYLLRPQTSTAATTSGPNNASIVVYNSTNTTGITLTVGRSLAENRLTKLDIGSGAPGADTETYYVPDDYYDMVSNIVAEYRKQVAGVELVTEQDDDDED